jgi:hypothetical protein
VDRVNAGGDRFAARGRIGGILAFAPSIDALKIVAGDAANPLAMTIPARDRGWKAGRRGVYTWTSSRSFLPGARLKLTLDTRRGTFSATASSFDFPAAPANPVTLGFALGRRAGAVSTAWTAKGAGRLVAK